jgi:hypothetical protein
MRKRLAIMAAMALLAAGQAGGARAQDVPAASECTVAPISAAAFATDLTTPVAATLPAHVATEAELPKGTPPDDVTLAAVKQTARMYIACANAGKLASQFSLLSPGAIFRAARPSGTPIAASDLDLYTQSIAVELSTPAAPKQTKLVALGDGRVLPDGRVGLIVTGQGDGSPTPKTDFFVFANIDGHWRIDEVILIDSPASPAASPIATPAGTPAA